MSQGPSHSICLNLTFSLHCNLCLLHLHPWQGHSLYWGAQDSTSLNCSHNQSSSHLHPLWHHFILCHHRFPTGLPPPPNVPCSFCWRIPAVLPILCLHWVLVRSVCADVMLICFHTCSSMKAWNGPILLPVVWLPSILQKFSSHLFDKYWINLAPCYSLITHLSWVLLFPSPFAMLVKEDDIYSTSQHAMSLHTLPGTIE